VIDGAWWLVGSVAGAVWIGASIAVGLLVARVIRLADDAAKRDHEHRSTK
jgi:hypothetical protein